MNTQEDTLWLSELSEELLCEAIIWPNAMMKLVHFTGILLSLLLVYGVEVQQWKIAVVAITALICIFFKGSGFVKDISLIKNELQRRKGKNKE